VAVVTVGRSSDVVVLADEAVDGVIEALPEQYRCIPIIAAACGLRQRELFGLAVEDIDLEDDVIYVRRQVKRLGNQYVFARPKNDRERVVPLPRWASESITSHLAKHGAVAVTLPWERTNGAPTTVRLLFRSGSDKHLQARIFDEVIWKPALAAAGLIPAPTKDARGRRRFVTDRRTGLHALRHFYASVTLADGVNVKELAEYLGHHDPGFTLRLYTHLLPSSFDRARRAVDNRMLQRPRTSADGPGTDQGRSRKVEHPAVESPPDTTEEPSIGL
jgi:integrase